MSNIFSMFMAHLGKQATKNHCRRSQQQEGFGGGFN